MQLRNQQTREVKRWSWDPPANGTEQEPTHRPGPVDIAADLREWVAPDRIRAWVDEAIGRLNWQNPQVVEFLRQHSALRPRVMLRLLAYAYCAQLFSSEEIVRACHSDRMFRLLCEGQAPFAQELRLFRRKHRSLLETILAGVFKLALTEKLNLAAAWFPPELEHDLHDRAVERLDIARHMDSTDE